MARKWTLGILILVLGLTVTSGAWAKEQYVYSVKFVCGYNPTNLGVSVDGKKEGEPSVKFGNYATEINLAWPEIYLGSELNYVFKSLIVLVDQGKPVGREPNVANGKVYIDSIRLPQMSGTMDDCNRIAELLWGAVPTPYPLTIGYLVITSVFELDVTAVYTAETCSNWKADGANLECFDPTGHPTNASISEDVVQVTGRKLLPPPPGTASARKAGGRK
jgi:hypothetical protein